MHGEETLDMKLSGGRKLNVIEIKSLKKCGLYRHDTQGLNYWAWRGAQKAWNGKSICE